MKYLYCVIMAAVLLAGGTAGAEIPVKSSTAVDRTSLEIMVYQNNIALIKDSRRINLPGGQGELRYTDVAARIIPDSLNLAYHDDGSSLRIIEQVYSYDLISEKNLLDRYVGKNVKIMDYNRHHDRRDILEATLLSNRDNRIYRIGEEIFLGHHGLTVLPEIPENLTAEPTLTMLFENDKSGVYEIEATYITENISWGTDYILRLGSCEKKADLTAWVSIDNRSGASWHDAKAFLVAGEVHRAADSRGDGFSEKVMLARSASSQGQFEEAPLFEYYRYNLERRTSVENNETRRILLLQANGIPMEKEYLLSGPRFAPRPYTTGTGEKQPVNVYLSFRNNDEGSPGMPLPAGIVRLYQSDENSLYWFIGEDRIAHTPREGEVRLRTGEAFDVTAERKQIEFRQITSRISEARMEITITNQKKEDITVTCMENLSGDWEIKDANLPFTVIDAFRVRFDIPVPSGGKNTLLYTVRTGS
ncbi:MAG: hypothetical protein PHU03_04400 [Syntrophales bacterium]|nr:hypothetical protein [Syntrophales bacterium]